VFDREEKIAGVLLQAHQETPDFIARLESQGFFASWNGLTASEAVALPVDAVSRATLTTRATIDSIKLRLSGHAAVELERKNIDYAEIIRLLLGWLFVLVSLLACYNRSGLAKYRTLILLAAVIVPGFMLGRFVSLELVMNWALNGIPLQAQFFMVVVLILSLALPLLSSRAWYCSWYCPFGAAQELAGKLFRRKIDGGEKFVAASKRLRPAILIIVVFLLLAGHKFNLSLVEPFSAFLLNSAAIPVLVMAALFLVLSLFMRRPWCNCFCPSGVILENLRFPGVFKDNFTDPKEDRKMRFTEVINLLLVIVIIIQVLSASRMAQSQPVPAGTGEKPASVTPVVSSAKDAVELDNPILKNIHARKSVRNFTADEVSEEQLITLVKAGMAAPTARNRQPWQFVVIRDKTAMQDLADKLPYAKMLASAAAAIVVCGDLEIARAGNSEDMWMLDCSAATQNVLLALESMGLGGVWTACYPYDDRMQTVASALSLPEHIVPLCVIPVGHPTGVDKPKDKWKPERLHWNKWQPEPK
jgi:nitroreductase